MKEPRSQRKLKAGCVYPPSNAFRNHPPKEQNIAKYSSSTHFNQTSVTTDTSAFGNRLEMRYSNCCSFKLTWRLMPSLIPPRSSRNISVRLKCVAQHARTISNIAEMGCKEQLSRRSTLVALVSLSGCTALARPGQGLSAPIPVDVREWDMRGGETHLEHQSSLV